MNEEIKERLNQCLDGMEEAIDELYDITYKNGDLNHHEELNQFFKRILLKYDK